MRAASFRVKYEIFDDAVLAAHAATSLVTFDFATNRPRRLSIEEREVLLGYADTPGAEPAVAVLPAGNPTSSMRAMSSGSDMTRPRPKSNSDMIGQPHD